mgnify:FL=1
MRDARYIAEERMRVQSQKDKQRWDDMMKNEHTQMFQIGDYVLMRHESKKGLEYNWMGPYRVVGANFEYNVYKLEEVDGKVYNSWVHTDRLHPVKYDGSPINKSWYIPRIARA